MKEYATINIKELARRVPPDYTSESLTMWPMKKHSLEKKSVGRGSSWQKPVLFRFVPGEKRKSWSILKTIISKRTTWLSYFPSKSSNRFIQHWITRQRLFSSRQTTSKRNAKKWFPCDLKCNSIRLLDLKRVKLNYWNHIIHYYLGKQINWILIFLN